MFTCLLLFHFSVFCYSLFPLREETQRRLKRKNKGVCHHRSASKSTAGKTDFFRCSLLVVVVGIFFHNLPLYLSESFVFVILVAQFLFPSPSMFLFTQSRYCIALFEKKKKVKSQYCNFYCVFISFH